MTYYSKKSLYYRLTRIAYDAFWGTFILKFKGRQEFTKEDEILNTHTDEQTHTLSALQSWDPAHKK